MSKNNCSVINFFDKLEDNKYKKYEKRPYPKTPHNTTIFKNKLRGDGRGTGDSEGHSRTGVLQTNNRPSLTGGNAEG